MSIPEKALGSLWGINLLAICAANSTEVRHCLAVLTLYAATYFLFAPLHALILLCVWMAYGLERGDSPLSEGTAARAAVRLVCAETLMFWGLYWGMVLELLPLHLRV
ncbi:MAG: hypothetical protein COV48_01640 [Elusimicrobia bacterium CG11_big_fil_rev_8_21_14_0_20_64_6]|nr:MAG: hypothetical protein COV48_01640 [Elusimicrobia bacterium CG11_big_fil_rev_8_21_14_0_20_64_6]